MPPLYLLIKPASAMCNLNCSYCFYNDLARHRSQKSYGIMSEATLESVIKKALAFATGECTIAFQGGEPTLAGLDFFKRAVELQAVHNAKKLLIRNALQTNGYRLGEDWAAFFAENHFLVGVSLDGTRHTHNRYRSSGDDGDTFTSVMQTIDLFNKHHVEYNILTVANEYTARSIRKIYAFYRKKGFSYLQFIPCLDPLDSLPGMAGYSLAPAVYGEFLKELFDMWYEDYMRGTPVSIRQFDNYLSLLSGNPAEACDMNGTCCIQNVVEADGGVYPCDFFVTDSYLLGNLNVCGFETLNARRGEIRFIEESASVDVSCQKCKFFPLCRGGCKRHRIMTGAGGNPASPDYFCEAYKSFFPYALERMLGIVRR